MKRIICYFIGHRCTLSDGFAEACDRCGSHSYYDYPNHHKYITNFWADFKWWFHMNVWHKCVSCKKVNFIFGKPVGKHDNCLPF